MNPSGIELKLLLETSRDSRVWIWQRSGKNEELARSKPERVRLITEPLSGWLQRTPFHKHGFLSEPGSFQYEILRSLDSSIIVFVWFEDSSEKQTWKQDKKMKEKQNMMDLPVSEGTCIFFIFLNTVIVFSPGKRKMNKAEWDENSMRRMEMGSKKESEEKIGVGTVTVCTGVMIGFKALTDAFYHTKDFIKVFFYHLFFSPLLFLNRKCVGFMNLSFFLHKTWRKRTLTKSF